MFHTCQCVCCQCINGFVSNTSIYRQTDTYMNRYTYIYIYIHIYLYIERERNWRRYLCRHRQMN